MSIRATASAPIFGVVELVLVTDGKGVHVDHRGLEACLRDDGRVLVDFRLLHGDQCEIHDAIVTSHHLVVEEYLVDGERDVMLRLELDDIRNLLGRHFRDLHLLHDEFSTGDCDGRAPALDARLISRLSDRVHDRSRVPNRSVGDRIGREGCAAEGNETPSTTLLAQLRELYRARADVEPESAWGTAKPAHLTYARWSVTRGPSCVAKLV